MSSTMLRMQHSSLERTDARPQQRRDLNDLFQHGRAFPIKTGTEAGIDAAGKNSNRAFLEHYAEKYDHALHVVTDNWIAVDRKIFAPKSFKRGRVFVEDSSNLVGKMYDRIMPTVTFDHLNKAVGTISVGAAHYAVKGAIPGDPNYAANRKYAIEISEWMREAGRGKRLAFANGDFNMNDRTLDWAFDRDFTSMADELNAWANTGHGPIDGFCSFDKDGRVSANKFEVLDDKDFFQFGDHYVARGTWEVRDLAA